MKWKPARCCVLFHFSLTITIWSSLSIKFNVLTSVTARSRPGLQEEEHYQHARTHARTHTRTHARTHTHARAHTHTHAHTHHTRARAHTRTHTHARTHARTHTHTHAHARTHTHTHTPHTYLLLRLIICMHFYTST